MKRTQRSKTLSFQTPRLPADWLALKTWVCAPSPIGAHLTSLNLFPFCRRRYTPPTPLQELGGLGGLMAMEVAKPELTHGLSLCSAMELEEGEVRPLALPMSTLLQTTPATAEGKERVSTGTKFALRLWLQHLGR